MKNELKDEFAQIRKLLWMHIRACDTGENEVYTATVDVLQKNVVPKDDVVAPPPIQKSIPVMAPLPVAEKRIEKTVPFIHVAAIQDTTLSHFEKQKAPKLIPRPYKPASTLFQFDQKIKDSLSQGSGVPFASSIQYKNRIDSIPPRWSIVSALHPTGASEEAQQFVQSLHKAIREKLPVTVNESPFQIQEVEKDIVKTVAIGDGSLLLFLGEEHQESYVKQFLSTLSGYTLESMTGFSPSIYLGTYFRATVLFFPIDTTSYQNSSIKKELWQCLKRFQ